MAKKRTSIMLSEKSKNQFDFLQKKHKDTVALSSERLVNFILDKIIKGDYDDLEPPKKDNPKLIYANYDLRQKADEKAKEQGFKGVKEMMETVIKEEFLTHSRGDTRKGMEDFLKVGSHERSVGDE